jgi:hypothetical protein
LQRGRGFGDRALSYSTATLLRLKLVRLVTRTETIEKLLRSLGEPTDAPALAPARDPPGYKSRVLRRRQPEQRALFDE